MRKKDLELELKNQSVKLQELERRNTILQHVVEHYADPLRRSDKGKAAKRALEMVASGYKPCTLFMSYKMKNKEQYPYLELQHYIDGREHDEAEDTEGDDK